MTYQAQVKSGETQKHVTTERTADGYRVKVNEYWKGEDAGEVHVAGTSWYAASHHAEEAARAYVAAMQRMGWMVEWENN